MGLSSGTATSLLGNLGQISLIFSASIWVWDSSWGSLGGDRTRTDPTRLVCCPMHAFPTLVPKKLKVNGTVSAVVRSTVQIKLHERCYFSYLL